MFAVHTKLCPVKLINHTKYIHHWNSYTYILVYTVIRSHECPRYQKKTYISKSAHEHISWKERGHVKTQILHTVQTTAADIKLNATQTEHVSWKERGRNNMLKQKSYILYRAQLLTQKLPNKTTLLLGVCHRYKKYPLGIMNWLMDTTGPWFVHIWNYDLAYNTSVLTGKTIQNWNNMKFKFHRKL